MGLDFGEFGKDSKAKAKEIEGSFSGAAMQFAPKIHESDEEEELLNADNLDEIEKQLEEIDEQVKSQDKEDEDAAVY
jgi:hypothetical protein